MWKKIELSGSGEPGFFFTNDKDWGMNPCAEISLRPFQTNELAVTGDNESTQLLAEYTLEVKNEAAHGIIADLTP